MNVKHILLLSIVCTVSFSLVQGQTIPIAKVIDNSNYTDTKYLDGEHVLVTKTNDTITNNIGNITLSAIPDGSQINNAIIKVSPNGDPTKQCTLQLKDKVLNQIQISNPFSCSGNQSVTLNTKGDDALENNLRTNSLGVIIKDSTSNTIPFSSVKLDANYTEQKYFTHVENGIVTNVITADQSFIDTQKGTWIETNPDGSIRGSYAGVGYSYDNVIDKFYPPKPYPSWHIDSNGEWQAPVQYPTGGSLYSWNELKQSWDFVK